MSEEPRMSDWATHLPALVAAVAATEGPILECGVGIWSTPVLHALCGASDRMLASVESKPEWLARFMPLASPRHLMVRVDDWYRVAAVADSLGEVAVAFVDHGHAPRGPVVAALRDRARIIVMHDSECHYCGYSEPLRAFDWCWTHLNSPTWTTIAGMGERPSWIEGALSPGQWGVPVPYRG